MNERERERARDTGNVRVYVLFRPTCCCGSDPWSHLGLKTPGNTPHVHHSALGSRREKRGVDRASLLSLISEQFSSFFYYDGIWKVDESGWSQTSIYGKLSVKVHRRDPRVMDDDELMLRSLCVEEQHPTVCLEMGPTYKRPSSIVVCMCVRVSFTVYTLARKVNQGPIVP